MTPFVKSLFNGGRILLPSTFSRRFYKMANQSISHARTCPVAVTQMTSISDKEKNLEICRELVKGAAKAGAKMVFLPEACDYIAETKEQSRQMAESIHGPLISSYKNLAISEGVWLSLGGLHIKEENEDKVSNTHIVIDDQGEIKSLYKKTHLFSVHIPEKNLRLEEASYISQGDAIHPPILTPAGNLALAICYDMRFPELSLLQRKMGAEILTFPSAFTVTTGQAHWETILRSRAIETQCYVIAAAQCGQHNNKRSSYGHAMVLSPWGAVLSEIDEGTQYKIVDIDLNHLHKVRRDMPVISHRRTDLYRLHEIPHEGAIRMCDLQPMPSPYVSYQFGSVSVPGSCVFLKSLYSQAFVNKKPVAPGHILITSERPAKRLPDLTSSELSDLIQLTQIAVEAIIEAYKPESLQLAIQDGPAAGQTIEHIHIHAVPMSADIKQKLQGHEKLNKWRDIDEMEEEATHLRHTIKKNKIGERKMFFPCIFEQFRAMEPTLSDDCDYGDLNIPNEYLIMKSKYSYAFIPPKPVIHGHVCVALLMGGTSFTSLAVNILTDLMLTVQLVQQEVEKLCETSSSTIFLRQDLHDKNQQYLQVHIIPRKEGDLPDNDDIYGIVSNLSWPVQEWRDNGTSSKLSIASLIKSSIFEKS